MDKLVGLISGASGIRSANDDDLADRLSSRYTVVILITFAVLIGMNQYVRNPITCWAPVHFTGAHTRFATNYCWVKNTYYLQWSQDVPMGKAEDRQMVPYYQWIPFILLFQAVFFYLPTMIWHGFNSKSGIDADNILQSSHAISNGKNDDARKKTMKMLVNQMDRFLSNRVSRKGWATGLKNFCGTIFGRRMGYYLLFLFMGSKILYIANIIGQLFLLNKILSIRFSSFGFDIISKMSAIDDWAESSSVAFPRVTYCDFSIRGQDLVNTQPYTVQCVLPINLYNEKIYLFLWFWMVLVLVASLVSFLVWAFRGIFFSDRVKFIRNHLLLGSKISSRWGLEERRLINQFLSGYLRQDGAFLLRLIAHNTNNVTTTEIICALWEHWMEKVNLNETKETPTLPTSRLYPQDIDLDDMGLQKRII